MGEDVFGDFRAARLAGKTFVAEVNAAVDPAVRLILRQLSEPQVVARDIRMIFDAEPVCREFDVIRSVEQA